MHNRRPPITEQPVLTVAPRDLDFGEVWETDEFRLVLPIHNNTPTRMRLTEWRSSCDCLGVEPSSLEFAPDGTRAVSVKLDLASKLRVRPTAAQTVAVNLIGSLSDGRSVTWQIHGVVKPLLKASPALSFAPLSELAQPYGLKPLALEFTEPVSLAALESDSPFVTASFGGAASRPHAQCLFALRFASVIPVGEHRFTLTARGEVPSSGQQFVKQLGGAIRVAADVQADPNHVVFPSKMIGECAEETVLLKSLTGRAVSIEAVTTIGEGLTAEATEGEPRVTIRQRSARGGQVTTRVHVVARSEGRLYDVVILVASLWINP